MTTNPRQEYGKTLVELGEKDKDIVVLEADLGRSTMSCFFQDAFPERYFEMGIAEANMASFAAGLAYAGKKPVINSFAMFSVGRAFDQIRQSICIPQLNVIINGSSAGLSDFGDGATHQMIEDIAVMRALPNMTIFVPADAREVRQMVQTAFKMGGPCYIRICRSEMEDIHGEDFTFEPGIPEIVREGSDVCIFAYGVMVHKALLAANVLEEKHISAKVVNVSTLKPLDGSRICDLAKGAKAVVTVEEHTIIGGLGEFCAYALRGTGLPMDCIAIDDRFGQSGESHEQLLDHYGLSVEAIVSRTEALLKR